VKRIIVCLDGTWNKATMGGPTTNVVAIRDSLLATMEAGRDQQRIYYDEGVGTGDPIDKLKGGAVGVGLAQNVRQAYKYIARHFEPGDEIYLIGFSRGAFTARSVAGYIAACGLLRAADCTTEREEAAWHHYHTLPKDRPSGDRAELSLSSHPDVKIKCVAVFDTVGALGVPGGLNWIGKSRFAFHDAQLNTCVENCFHAVAIDEKRMTFIATMWEQPFNLAGPPPKVQQVWFPGVHGDIGGGYSDNDLSRNVLDWMIARLRELKVEFLPHADPDPQRRKPLGPIHESRKLVPYGLSRIWPLYRPIDGIAVNKRSERSTDTVQYSPIFEYVHRAALDRWKADGRYRPANLREVLSLIASERLSVIDWDGSAMPLAAVQTEFASVLAEASN
jgi:uncharacterized protein (DUF2235 family)